MSFSQRGKSSRSMRKMEKEVEISMKTDMEPAGTWKRGPI